MVLQDQDVAAIVEQRPGTQRFPKHANILELMTKPWQYQPNRRLFGGLPKLRKLLNSRNFGPAVGRIAVWLLHLKPWDVGDLSQEDWARGWSKHTDLVRDYNAVNDKNIVWSVVPVCPLQDETVVEYVAMWCARQLRIDRAWPTDLHLFRNAMANFARERAKFPHLAQGTIERCAEHLENELLHLVGYVLPIWPLTILL